MRARASISAARWSHAQSVDTETHVVQRGVTVFAALYAPSLPAAALLEVARAFTPRFEQIGSVVLLDASGLSRLFGSAQELGEHLRDALAKQSPGDSLPRVAIASTQTAATLLALGQPGLTVVMPGKEAIALAPLSVNVLDAIRKSRSPLGPGTRHAAPTPARGTRHEAPPALGRRAGIIRGARIRPAAASGELLRIGCSKS